VTSVKNLFQDLPQGGDGELVDTILSRPGVTVERIVSHGHQTPWLEQGWDEWVMVVQGSARLSLNGDEHLLGAGDHLLIPAGVRHRVLWTDPEADTFWLVLHFRDGEVVSSVTHEIWRQDDNGNRFFVETFTDRMQALRRERSLARGGHRQIYWVEDVVRYTQAAQGETS